MRRLGYGSYVGRPGNSLQRRQLHCDALELCVESLLQKSSRRVTVKESQDFLIDGASIRPRTPEFDMMEHDTPRRSF